MDSANALGAFCLVQPCADSGDEHDNQYEDHGENDQKFHKGETMPAIWIGWPGRLMATKPRFPSWLHVRGEQGSILMIFCPTSCLASPIRPAMSFFLWRQTVKNLSSAPQAPFVPVEETPRL